MAERFMGAMARASITVLIITQASSESSITVAVPSSQGPAALAALQVVAPIPPTAPSALISFATLAALRS